MFLDPETVDYDESLPWTEPYCFYDAEGNRYANPTSSCWNENGELVDHSSAYTVENDYLEKIKPFIDKLIEKQQSQNNTGSLQSLCA